VCPFSSSSYCTSTASGRTESWRTTAAILPIILPKKEAQRKGWPQVFGGLWTPCHRFRNLFNSDFGLLRYAAAAARADLAL
jgi:hypothetical protein